MRMTASWSRSSGICRIQGCGARSPRPPPGRLTSIVLCCLLLVNAGGLQRRLIPTGPSARRPREPRGSGRKDEAHWQVEPKDREKRKMSIVEI
jgi:hypothetical protein